MPNENRKYAPPLTQCLTMNRRAKANEFSCRQIDMGAEKPRIPDSKNQQNLPTIKMSVILLVLLSIGFLFLLLQLFGLT
jgi:hypothetical protein